VIIIVEFLVTVLSLTYLNNIFRGGTVPLKFPMSPSINSLSVSIIYLLIKSANSSKNRLFRCPYFLSLGYNIWTTITRSRTPPDVMLAFMHSNDFFSFSLPGVK